MYSPYALVVLKPGANNRYLAQPDPGIVEQEYAPGGVPAAMSPEAAAAAVAAGDWEYLTQSVPTEEALQSGAPEAEATE